MWPDLANHFWATFKDIWRFFSVHTGVYSFNSLKASWTSHTTIPKRSIVFFGSTFLLDLFHSSKKVFKILRNADDTFWNKKIQSSNWNLLLLNGQLRDHRDKSVEGHGKISNPVTNWIFIRSLKKHYCSSIKSPLR